ncbi:MAG: hypothetical protein QXD61_11825 [Candidatus Caldarchaeum sp.]
MKVSYAGDIEAVCLNHVWKPGEVKDLPEDEALLLVSTNPNFVQVEEE